MILPMSRIRIIGPRRELPGVLGMLQDVGAVHLAPPDMSAGQTQDLPQPAQSRYCRNLQRIIGDVEAALSALQSRGRDPVNGGTPPLFPAAARRASRVRRKAEALIARQHQLEEELALILKYKAFFSAFEAFLSHPERWAGSHAFHVLLKAGQADTLGKLRQELARILGPDFQLWSQLLPGGETALLLLVAPSAVPRVEQLMGEGRIQEIPVPAGYGGGSLAEAIPRMMDRLGALPGEKAQAERERLALLAAERGPLVRIRNAAQDALLRADALARSGFTAHTFVLEGWVPSRAAEKVRSALAGYPGGSVTMEEIGREQWRGTEAPVVLSNPRLFRPFELIVRMLPLPRYGSIDPTPFVAVFFPMFFGVAMGDVGYGLALALLALVLRRRSRPGSVTRSLSEVAGACAAFSVAFGIMFGELFGDLGHRWFGLTPLVMDREHAVIPFLGLAVGLGLVHILLGLVLGVAGGHTRRERIGHGVAAAMVLLIVVALLAAFNLLPAGLFTPAVIALLAAFPVLIVAEGLIAPIELLTTLGNVLSYARIMALGTASVMLAIVANRMTGAMGSAVVGIIFALLFHLVNFALGLFSPTIHALRLHYVEFFGKFYSPGGIEYRPLMHWTTVPPRKGP
jgi:V/A-type H+-transporting ATPase subunit I